jgi:[ribosomal protein S18]-alanine N-acetyltransferase
MQSGEMAFRRAGILDAELLAFLYRECLTANWDRPWSAKSFGEILSLPGTLAWLASEKDQPAGFALGSCAGDEIDLLLIAVRPAWRRRATGSTLLLRLLDGACQQGASRAVLEVAAPNKTAIAFYESLGFTRCGSRKDYYQDGIDALLLEKKLSRP